ncbi:hypothetical protein G3T14_13155 [Methylobacterium sp. BTF04]|uniref:hypothetical protein n=1 Tax=Methylobacterium sp. BTF04 TaxID=2708300 RepID=UPI0013D02B41|nr:hypothetical protein [Methylobacterium sp. BTF04]NEU13081.1 hypothetical protein [Methylobacterium sp. BTF04]
MSSFDWVERFSDGLVFCAVMMAFVGVAVACAPPLSGRRVPVLVKRSRGTARY